jgi:hypothetical protein
MSPQSWWMSSMSWARSSAVTCSGWSSAASSVSAARRSPWGFGEPLGDELGVHTRFDRRSVPLDLHVGRGDAPAGRVGSLVDARISGGTVEEVSECVLDVLGIEQLAASGLRGR